MQIRERDIHIRVKGKAKTERLVRTKVEATTGSSDLDGATLASLGSIARRELQHNSF